MCCSEQDLQQIYENPLPYERFQAFRCNGITLPMRLLNVSVKVIKRPPIKDLLALLAADEGDEVALVEERVEPRVLSSLP